MKKNKVFCFLYRLFACSTLFCFLNCSIIFAASVAPDPDIGITSTRYLPYKKDCSVDNNWSTFPIKPTTKQASSISCVSKRYCSDICEETKDEVVTKKLCTTNPDSNCLLKSCIHLTEDEHKLVNKSRLIGSEADPTGIKYKKFCEPFSFSETETSKAGNVYYFNTSDKKLLYCFEFEKNVLQYLWLKNNTIDESGKNINKDEKGNFINTIYSCEVHQCPLDAFSSDTCSTNYMGIFNKSADYKIEYETYILSNTNPNESIITRSCEKTTCDNFKITTSNSCDKNMQDNLLYKETCDEYNSVDIKLKQYFPDIYAEKIKGLNKQKCVVSEGLESVSGSCNKTFDCAAPESRDNPLCNNEYIEQDHGADSTRSYFFRPVPPPVTTEVVKFNCNEGNEACSILDLPTRESLSNSNINGKTIIKRIMRGLKDDSAINTVETEKYDTTKRKDHIHDYFRFRQNTDDEKNAPTSSSHNSIRNYVCARSTNEFKYYDYYDTFWKLFGKWKFPLGHAKYYNVFWGVTEPTDYRPFIPLCNTSSLGVILEGRHSNCVGPYEPTCHAANWDSYYIKGTPKIIWNKKEPKVDRIELIACMRKTNSGALDACGIRQCRVDCAFGACATQWCGIDSCRSMAINANERCDKEAIKAKIHSPECIGDLSSSIGNVRFRLSLVGNKAYVFYDQGDALCKKEIYGGDQYQGITDMVRRRDDIGLNTPAKVSGNEATFGTPFKGRMDEYSLVDDNTLTDHNNDGRITDEDVFGEYLGREYRCHPNYVNQCLAKYNNPSKEEIAKCAPDPFCRTHNSQSSQHQIEFLKQDWVTFDIVSYIGNNQPTKGNSNCLIGSKDLNKCRGFYDNEGVFHKEQQGILFALPNSPTLFYKYATIKSMPDLFMPLLSVISFRSVVDGEIYRVANADENKFLLNFFEPYLEIKYGTSGVTPTSLSFSEVSTDPLRTISSEFQNETVTTKYKLVKKASLYPTPMAEVCLYQILEDNYEQEISCFDRDLPSQKTLLIKPVGTKEKIPYINMYLRNPIKKEIEPGERISNAQLKDENLFIPFSTSTILNLPENLKLYGNNIAYAQNFPVRLDNSSCSKIYYDCLFTRKKLVKAKFEAETNFTNENELKSLQQEVNNCEMQIERSCNKNDGSNNLIQLTNNNKSYIISVKDDYNVHGTYNEMCVAKGFESHPTYVVSHISKDDILAKCNLTDKSKNKAECRRKVIYKYCSDGSNPNCVSINGTTNKKADGSSLCSITSKNCIEKIDCQNCGVNCTKLPSECYLSGVNGLNILMKPDSDDVDISCECSFISSGESVPSGFEIRNATPRELGLCSPLKSTNFCEPVKYYNEDKIYYDGGEGNNLSYIKTEKPSNIWRTSQKLYGKYYFSDLGNAEFEKGNVCDSKDDESCLLLKRCYNSKTGAICSVGSANCVCTDYVQKGSCIGFWKNKDNTIPLAKCVNKATDTNEIITLYELVPNTECERYACSEINSSNVILYKEATNNLNDTEASLNTANTKGLFHGFALWDSYKKGSFDAPKRVAGSPRLLENGHGDDIEERIAKKCLNGYAPAGSNYILYNYLPTISNTTDKTQILSKQEAIIKKMIGYDLNSNLEDIDVADPIFAEYARATGYNAFLHLPVRYCNQIGKWEVVNDLYSRFLSTPYYVGNEKIHNTDNKGFVKNVGSSGTLPEKDYNTYNYGSTDVSKKTDYSKRYCERLYCPEISPEMIGSNSVELFNSNNNQATYSIPSETNNNYYPSELGLNYPKNPQNIQDSRVNTIFNSSKTPWRHAGGAFWKEIPSPKNANSLNITGKCLTPSVFAKYKEDNKLSSLISDSIVPLYFPKNSIFKCENDKNLSGVDIACRTSFSSQYNEMFPSNTSLKEVDPKKSDLLNSTIGLTEPTRTCSAWGVWGAIDNRCVASCEPIDVFRTNFTDTNGDGFLQNHEVNRLLRTPKYRSNYFVTEGSIKYGDKFTGGAQWGRGKGGDFVVGECDTTVGKNSGLPSFPVGGIQFLTKGGNQVSSTGYVQARETDIGTKTLATANIFTKKRPYRYCNLDGTWGKVYDPCVNFLTCPENRIYTKNLFNEKNSSIILKDTFQLQNSNKVGSSNENDYKIEYVTTLNSGNIDIADVEKRIEDKIANAYEIPVITECGNSPFFKEGQISRSCNVSTGDWMNNLQNGCSLKTCFNDNIINIHGESTRTTPIGNEKYFAKSSGFANSFSKFNNIIYAGYQITNTCSLGYTCDNCTNNLIIKTCDLKEQTQSAEPQWTNAGTCKPLTCSIGSLRAMIGNSVSEVSLKNAFYDGAFLGATPPNNYQFASEVLNPKNKGVTFANNQQPNTDTEWTVGSNVSLSCNSGYIEYPKDLYARCVIDSNNPSNPVGKWLLSGGGCTKVCDKRSLAKETLVEIGRRNVSCDEECEVPSQSFSCADSKYKIPNDILHKYPDSRGYCRLPITTEPIMGMSDNPPIIDTAPGVPGSLFYPSYSTASITGAVLDEENGEKARYFTNGAMIDASCASGYIEVSDGGHSEAGIGGSMIHAYICIDGNWKRRGTCVRQECRTSTGGTITIPNFIEQVTITAYGEAGASGDRDRVGTGGNGVSVTGIFPKNGTSTFNRTFTIERLGGADGPYQAGEGGASFRVKNNNQYLIASAGGGGGGNRGDNADGTGGNGGDGGSAGFYNGRARDGFEGNNGAKNCLQDIVPGANRGGAVVCENNPSEGVAGNHKGCSGRGGSGGGGGAGFNKNGCGGPAGNRSSDNCVCSAGAGGGGGGGGGTAYLNDNLVKFKSQSYTSERNGKVQICW